MKEILKVFLLIFLHKKYQQRFKKIIYLALYVVQQYDY